MDSSWLFISSFFSLIGAVVLLHGWRQRMAVPTVIGLVLSVYPYFIDGVVPLTVIGVGLIGVLFVGTRMENEV